MMTDNNNNNHASTPARDEEEAPAMLTLDFEPQFKQLRSLESMTLEWKDVNYYVNKGGKREKHIIKGVSGQANPGEVVAIMG